MKNFKILILFHLLLSFFIIGCYDDNCDNSSNTLCGEWTWEQSSGSIAGITITPDTEMITRTLKISDNKYKEFVDDVLILDSGYELTETKIKFDSGEELIITIEEEEFHMSEQDPDGWSHSYRRK